MQSPDLVGLFIAPLNRAGITYMATGSVAAMVYGEPRLTNDIDVVVSLEPDGAIAFAAAFDRAGLYVPPPEVIAAEAARTVGGHFNLIHGPSALKADVYVAGIDELHGWALPRRRQVSVGREVLWIAPPEYVILRKLQYYRDGGSEKHLRDIRRILAVSRSLLDRPEIERWVGRLGIGREWHAAQDAGPG